jgi:hypothetical protein
MSLDGSGMPSHYYGYFRSPERFVYPTRDVAQWTGAIAVEAAVASWWLWRARSVPATCVVLALLFGPALAVLAPFAMHAPPYFGAHLLFLLFAVAWFVVAALATWLARFAKRRAGC